MFKRFCWLIFVGVTTDLPLVCVAFFFFFPEAAGCLPFVNPNTL